MAVVVKKQLSFDTNFLFDLAKELDFAHTLIEVLRERGYSLGVPPTVTHELVLCSKTKTRTDCQYALIALQKMVLDWQIVPWSIAPIQHGIAAHFSKSLLSKGFLPDDEFNDGLVLAETALLSVRMLVTSDNHLLSLRSSDLNLQFDNAGLEPVSVVSPRSLLRALKT